MTRRPISRTERVRIFEAARGICSICGEKIDGARERWDVSHEVPLALGGADDAGNMRPAHERCHRRHTAEVDAPAIAKAKRVRAKHIGARAQPIRPLPGGKKSQWKQTIANGWVRRDG